MKKQKCAALLPQALHRDLSLTQPGRHEHSHCSAAPTPASCSPGCGAEHKPSPPAGKQGTEPTSSGAAPAPAPRTVLRGCLQEFKAAQPLGTGGTGRSSWIYDFPMTSVGKKNPTPDVCTGMGCWEFGAATGASVGNTGPQAAPQILWVSTGQSHDLERPCEGFLLPSSLFSQPGHRRLGAPPCQVCYRTETLPCTPDCWRPETAWKGRKPGGTASVPVPAPPLCLGTG